MAEKASFTVSAITQTEKQAQFGIVSVCFTGSAGDDFLFGPGSSLDQFSVTKTGTLAEMQEKYLGKELTGYKTRCVIRSPWTNASGRVIRHRLYLEKDEAAHVKSEELVEGVYLDLYEGKPTIEVGVASATGAETATAVTNTEVAAAMQPLQVI